MNPHLDRLQPYPFQKLTTLLDGTQPPAELRRIPLHIGEPKHATPELIKRALVDSLDGLAAYPPTAGSDALRGAIAGWLQRRHGLREMRAADQVIPVTGSREALFAFAQSVINNNNSGAGAPVVVSVNPFYQIYEGAALLAGAETQFLNTLPDRNFALDLEQLPESVWRRTQLVYVCSPANPTGRVMPLAEWRQLFEYSDRYGFVIAADECYSEIYFDEAHPPLGSLQAAQQLGRDAYPRLVSFGSLSKRSNVPGMRSGYVAGDAAILKKFLLYRTYHGCAMSPVVAAASIAAWNDEAHVVENRRLYREKFSAAVRILRDVNEVAMPDAAFYLWLRVGGNGRESDTAFTRRLMEQQNVSVLPGSYLAREANGVNPGAGFVRIALVANTAECTEAAERIAAALRAA
ncbi:MAG: succinyldiaminopimelate transaminase [Burkholderiales bacterium]